MEESIKLIRKSKWHSQYTNNESKFAILPMPAFENTDDFEYR